MESTPAETERTIDIEVAPQIWMRRLAVTRGLGLFLGAVTLAGVVMILVAPHPNEPHRGWAVYVLAPLILGAPFVLVVFRCLRAGLYIGPDGVVLRGFFRTRHLSLQEVESFEPGALEMGGLAARAYGVAMRRRDGRRLPVIALSKTGKVWGDGEAVAIREWQPTVDALNELLASLKGGSVPEPTETCLSREEARRFVAVVALSNALAFVVLLGAAMVSPGMRTLLLILAAIYIPIGIAVTVYLGRHAHGRIGKTASE